MPSDPVTLRILGHDTNKQDPQIMVFYVSVMKTYLALVSNVRYPRDESALVVGFQLRLKVYTPHYVQLVQDRQMQQGLCMLVR